MFLRRVAMIQTVVRRQCYKNMLVHPVIRSYRSRSVCTIYRSTVSLYLFSFRAWKLPTLRIIENI